MSYTVSLSNRARKFLRGLTDAKLCRRLESAIDDLRDEPRPSGSVKLSGADDLHRVRVGDYRIIYSMKDDLLFVLVVEIGHRREIYR